jgi:5'-3' exonuclease
MTLLLIDGDQFVFKATVAVEKEVLWDEHNHVLFSNENEAYDTLTGMLERIFVRFDSRDCALCFSDPPNFRHEIEPTYKGHRATRKPLCYATLREKIEAEHPCVSLPGLEADDVMGILATKPGPRKRIIVSQDKDMKTVPSTVWDGADLVTVTEAQADYQHLYQTLIGDTSDGYKGCPGIGPKKASQLLDPPFKPELLQEVRVPALWKVVVEAYVKAGLTEADALTQARLARILRWTDWDGENKRPILWTP